MIVLAKGQKNVLATEAQSVTPSDGFQVYWVAVKELNLSYYIGGTLFIYYIYPFW